jgi:hypothetical protein
MPKRDKKNALPADDFDEMLADFKAANLQQSADVPISSGSSSSGSSSQPSWPATNVMIPEVTIIKACRAGDITPFRRWARQGVRVVGPSVSCSISGQARIGANIIEGAQRWRQ